MSEIVIFVLALWAGGVLLIAALSLLRAHLLKRPQRSATMIQMEKPPSIVFEPYEATALPWAHGRVQPGRVPDASPGKDMTIAELLADCDCLNEHEECLIDREGGGVNLP